jgi:hypothetical protein
MLITHFLRNKNIIYDEINEINIVTINPISLSIATISNTSTSTIEHIRRHSIHVKSYRSSFIQREQLREMERKKIQEIHNETIPINDDKKIEDNIPLVSPNEDSESTDLLLILDNNNDLLSPTNIKKKIDDDEDDSEDEDENDKDKDKFDKDKNEKEKIDKIEEKKIDKSHSKQSKKKSKSSKKKKNFFVSTFFSMLSTTTKSNLNEYPMDFSELLTMDTSTIYQPWKVKLL